MHTYTQVKSLLEGCITRGSNGSALLVGPRGRGKTAVVDSVLAVWLSVCVCMCVCEHALMPKHIHMYMHTYTYIYMYALYIYKYIYIHTHTYCACMPTYMYVWRMSLMCAYTHHILTQEFSSTYTFRTSLSMCVYIPIPTYILPQELSSTYTFPGFITLRLNGLIDTNDHLALKSIAKQLYTMDDLNVEYEFECVSMLLCVCIGACM
jgi:hypothetical protein